MISLINDLNPVLVLILPNQKLQPVYGKDVNKASAVLNGELRCASQQSMYPQTSCIGFRHKPVKNPTSRSSEPGTFFR